MFAKIKRREEDEQKINARHLLFFNLRFNFTRQNKNTKTTFRFAFRWHFTARVKPHGQFQNVVQECETLLEGE